MSQECSLQPQVSLTRELKEGLIIKLKTFLIFSFLSQLNQINE